ncbi:hypothetical protein JOB18_044035, partial [Solea senegalensis]
KTNAFSEPPDAETSTESQSFSFSRVTFINNLFTEGTHALSLQHGYKVMRVVTHLNQCLLRCEATLLVFVARQRGWMKQLPGHHGGEDSDMLCYGEEAL